MKILILNGPNINLLDQRPVENYGSLSSQKLEQIVKKEFPQHKIDFFQSNLEGELIDKIQSVVKSYDGLVINPGGYSHTSIAIKDALEICTKPKIEVHISNLAKRENLRHTLVTAASCDGYISGFREKSYIAAIYLLEKITAS